MEKQEEEKDINLYPWTFKTIPFIILLNIVKIYYFNYIVMRLKSELYKKEQEKTLIKFIIILDLEKEYIYI